MCHRTLASKDKKSEVCDTPAHTTASPKRLFSFFLLIPLCFAMFACSFLVFLLKFVLFCGGGCKVRERADGGGDGWVQDQ